MSAHAQTTSKKPEAKVVAGSLAALIIGGLATWLAPLLAKAGLTVDAQTVTGVVGGVVTGLVALGSGFAAKHTHRADLAGQVEAAVGVDPAQAASLQASIDALLAAHLADHAATRMGPAVTAPATSVGGPYTAPAAPAEEAAPTAAPDNGAGTLAPPVGV